MPRTVPVPLARDERAWIATGVVLLHVAALAWLLTTRPTLPRQPQAGDATTLVYFIRRPTAASPVPLPPARPTRTRAPAPTPTPTDTGDAGARPRAHASTGALVVVELPRPAARDLQLPDDYVDIDFGRSNGVTGQPSGLDPRTTRFEDDWATDGDAIEKLKEDHLVARIALGLFGGRDTCTEKAIRNRRADCVGKDFQPEMQDAVQGY